MPIKQNDCHGAKKQDLVKRYDIKPIAYVRLLPGQTKNNCCGGHLSDVYYSFEYIHKVNSTDKGSFNVGYDCGKQIFDLLKIDPHKYRLFDPLAHLRTGSGSNHGSSGTPPQPKIVGLNLEVYNAIHLICVAWNSPPYGKVAETLEYVRNPSNKPTQEWAVVMINRILEHDIHHKTLTQIINDLIAQGHHLKAFQFPLMSQIIKDAIKTGTTPSNNIN